MANRGTALVVADARRIDLSTASLYDVEMVPRVFAVAPAAVHPAAGAILTIHGSGFGGRACDLEVVAAGTTCTPLSLNGDDGTVVCRMDADPVSTRPPRPRFLVAGGGALLTSYLIG